MSDSKKTPMHSDFNMLKITALIAEGGSPEYCAKLLIRLADRILTGEPIPEEAKKLLSAALLNTAQSPGAARSFLVPNSKKKGSKKTAWAMEVYLRIRERMEQEPNRPLTDYGKMQGHFSVYASETDKSETRIRDVYYEGEILYKKLIANFIRENYKFTNVLPLENARDN